MNSRERVIKALNREEPDQVPFCDVAVDKGLAQKLLEWEGDADIGSSSRTENPYTVEESKAISACLGLDNISYLLRAPTYVHMHTGIDGRTFVGHGMIKSEEDLSMINLPDPYDDALYQEAEEEVKYLIQNVAPGGGYIVTSGNSLASYLKPDCVMAMAKAVKKYGRYPIDL